MIDGIRKHALSLLLVVLTVYCQHFQFTYSASVSIRYCLTMDIRFVCLNMLIAAIPLFLTLKLLWEEYCDSLKGKDKIPMGYRRFCEG